MGFKLTKQSKTISLCLLLSGLMFGLWFFQHLNNRRLDSFQGALLATPRIMPSYQLMGVDGEAFTKEQLKGRWTWIFFGFTSCPQLCPTTLATLARAYQTLETKQVPMLPRIVMISLDPKQDNLKRLGAYVKAFDQHFYGARGDEAVVKVLARDLGVVYQKVSLSKGYTIDHSGAVIVVNPEGKLQAFLTPPYSVESLVQDHLLLIRKS